MVSEESATARHERGLREATALLQTAWNLIPPTMDLLGVTDIRREIQARMAMQHPTQRNAIMQRIRERVNGDPQQLSLLSAGVEDILSDTAACGNNLRIHQVRGDPLDPTIARRMKELDLDEQTYAEHNTRHTFAARVLAVLLESYGENGTH